MTAQIPNTIIISEERFSIAGFTHDGLIDPSDFGIEPKSSSSACWRGFKSTYKIDKDSNFILDELIVNTNPADKPIEINGILPKTPTNKFSRKAFNRAYEQINLQVNYTGFVLVGTNFIHELYVHMGIHKAWKYKTVFEIEIDQGKVKSIVDLSDKMEEVRTKFKEQKKNNLGPVKNEISEWVDKAFNQRYKKS